MGKTKKAGIIVRILTCLAATATIALGTAFPAFASGGITDAVDPSNISVKVPTSIPCTMMADGTVVAPPNLFIENFGDAVVVDAYTADIMGNDIDYALNIGSSSALTRTEGKDTAPICGIDLSAGSNELLALKISKLNRQSNAAFINSVTADNTTDMFKLGFRFTSKSLVGNVTIAGDTLVGSTLTANTSGLQPDAVPGYQWYRDGVKISGALDKTYMTVDDDSAREVTCKVIDASGKYAGELVSNIIIPEKPAEAFAVYSADDNSLNFYKRPEMPSVGTQFEGKTVTEVYTGFEESEYTSNSLAPWYARHAFITNVEFVDVVKPRSTAYWFYNCHSLTNLDVFNLDTSATMRMNSMFTFCSKLISLDVSNFDTSNVKYMNGMFQNCIAITSLNLSNFDTSSVIDMNSMFSSCANLIALDASSFNTENVIDMSYMFNNCHSISELDISNFKTATVRNMEGMFSYCYALTTLDVTNLNTSKVMYMRSMFKDCNSLIYLDLSSFDTSSVIDMLGMFSIKSSRLQQVKLGERFAWKGRACYLPRPNVSNIPEADGKWYAMSDGKGYESIDIPSNKADTYSAIPPRSSVQSSNVAVKLTEGVMELPIGNSI